MPRRGLEQVKAVQVQAESAVRAKRALEALLSDPQLMLHPTDAFAIAAIAMGTLALPIGNLKSEAWAPAMTHGLNSLCQVAPKLALESGFATLIQGPTFRFLRSRPKRLLRWAHGVQHGAPDGSRWQVPVARLPAVKAALAQALPTPQGIEAAVAHAIRHARSDVRHRSKGRETLARVYKAEARERLRAGFCEPGAATKCMRRSTSGRFYLSPMVVRSVARLSSKDLRVSVDRLEGEHLEALQAAKQAQDATEAIDSRETVRKVRESLPVFEEAICEILRSRRKDDKVTLAARDWLLDWVRASTGHGEPPLAIAEFAASRGVDRSHLNKRIAAARQALGKHPALRHLAPD